MSERKWRTILYHFLERSLMGSICHLHYPKLVFLGFAFDPFCHGASCVLIFLELYLSCLGYNAGGSCSSLWMGWSFMGFTIDFFSVLLVEKVGTLKA